MLAKYKLCLILVLLITANSLKAQKTYQWKTGSSGGYAYKYVSNDPTKSRFYTLKNGLTVVLSQNTKVPKIEFKLAVRAGSNTDPNNATGLAHYLEHMLFKGTDKFGTLNYAKEKPLLDRIEMLYEQYRQTTDPLKRKAIYAEIDQVSGEASNYSIAGEYGKMMKSIGGKNSNAHTWHEETVYDEDFPSNAVDPFLALQAERFRNPVFRIFHTELEAVYEEKNRGLDDDGRKVEEQSAAKLFPTHNYGQQTTIGTIAHLKNPSLVEIRKYYNKYYVPNNMLLVFAGDFVPDELIKKINHSFAYMQPKPLELYHPAPEKPITKIEQVDVYGPSAGSVKISYRGAAQATAESRMLSLISSILFNGNAGLADINLNQQQKVQFAGGEYRQMKDYGVFSLSAQPKKGKTLDQARQLLLDQITLLKNGDFDESLIKATVANKKLELLKESSQNRFRVNAIMREFILSRGVNWDNTLNSLDAMAGTTKKQVTDFAKQFFRDNYVLTYKHQGVDKNIVKVEKPLITPVKTNALASSDFAKALSGLPVKPILPKFLDYKKDLNFGKAGIADVITVQNKDNSLFTLTYRFDIGSWNLPLLSYAAQYLPFLSTDQYSAAEIKKQFYTIACNYNFNVDAENASITISGLQENFDKAITLTEQIFAGCKADEQALTELKDAILQERENNKSDKDYIQAGLNSYSQYGPKNPFNTNLSNDEIRKISSAQLLSLLHSFNDYKHTITYFGPKSMAGLRDGLTKFHHLPKAFLAEPAVRKYAPLPTDTSEVYFVDYEMVQAEVSWFRNSENYDSKLQPKIDLFNSYFGGGMESVVAQSIRESKGLAYSTDAYYLSSNQKGRLNVMTAYVGSQADKMNDAVKSMNELLADLPEVDQSFEVSKRNVLNGIETSRITDERMISAYFTDKRRGLAHDSRIDLYEGLKPLTFEDIKVFHKEHVAGKPYKYAIIAAEKNIKMEDLQQLGKVTKLSLEEIFGY
ncbi:Predicted Zn-dependent peptidase [Pedobacter terrae]|uniref:Predicted Zn-dependent peptidase n=1 Tax=Pedobacter terrae TaxID=405671 RepID=A0A1G7USI7_9SPHI|nr:M16 family metallopeptidase [Pedobacter terrae]SDG50483.1 Predicted Zn-dependent peptidase [Pedobacter terrae]